MKNIFFLFALLFVLYNLTPAQSGFDTIQVSTGWNLIGGLATGYIPSIVTTVPPGIITGSIYGYTPGSGYQAADTLNREDGYWVKVSQNGKIIIGLTIPFVCGTSQVYYSGRNYNTVQIGTQCWLKENLDIGMMILSSQNASNNGVIEKYCYGNDLANCLSLGGLYQWDEMMQYGTIPGSKGICPIGWHLPTDVEFATLNVAVGGNGYAIESWGQGGVGTNTSGFSAFLAGAYGGYPTKIFGELCGATALWTSKEDFSTDAFYLTVHSWDNGMPINSGFKDNGFSVRCVKD